MNNFRDPNMEEKMDAVMHPVRHLVKKVASAIFPSDDDLRLEPDDTESIPVPGAKPLSSREIQEAGEKIKKHIVY